MKRRLWSPRTFCMMVSSFIVCSTLMVAPGIAQDFIRPKETVGMYAMVCRDGSTVVYYSDCNDGGQIADLVFADATGKVRGKVIQQHSLGRMSLSPDGYLVVWGRLPKSPRHCLTLYNPDGNVCFRKEYPSTADVYACSAAARGRSTAVLVYDPKDKASADTGEFTVFGNSGSVVYQKIEKLSDARWLSFTPDDKHLLVKGEKFLQLLDATDMSPQWKVDGIELGHMMKEPIAMTSDQSRMAILCNVKLEEPGTQAYPLTVLVMDAKTGKVISKTRLNLGFHPANIRAIKYNSSKDVFEVTGEDKSIQEIASK